MTKVEKRSSKHLEIDTNKNKDLNFEFSNHKEEDEIYPLTTIEIAEAQHKYQELTPVMPQEKRSAIFRFDFVAGAQIVPQKCLCDRKEKDGWDGHHGQKFVRGSVYL